MLSLSPTPLQVQPLYTAVYSLSLAYSCICTISTVKTVGSYFFAGPYTCTTTLPPSPLVLRVSALTAVNSTHSCVLDDTRPTRRELCVLCTVPRPGTAQTPAGAHAASRMRSTTRLNVQCPTMHQVRGDWEARGTRPRGQAFYLTMSVLPHYVSFFLGMSVSGLAAQQTKAMQRPR